MPKPKDLRVAANPYHVLDGDGEPAGFVERGDIKGRIACAQRDADGKLAHDLDAVETLPSTPMHRRYVSDGALFPADEATAKTCGVDFVPLAKARAAAKERAANRFLALYGELPAWASSPSPTPTASKSAPSAAG